MPSISALKLPLPRPPVHHVTYLPTCELSPNRRSSRNPAGQTMCSLQVKYIPTPVPGARVASTCMKLVHVCACEHGCLSPAVQGHGVSGPAPSGLGIHSGFVSNGDVDVCWKQEMGLKWGWCLPRQTLDMRRYFNNLETCCHLCLMEPSHLHSVEH